MTFYGVICISSIVEKKSSTSSDEEKLSEENSDHKNVQTSASSTTKESSKGTKSPNGDISMKNVFYKCIIVLYQMLEV